MQICRPEQDASGDEASVSSVSDGVRRRSIGGRSKGGSLHGSRSMVVTPRGSLHRSSLHGGFVDPSYTNICLILMV